MYTDADRAKAVQAEAKRLEEFLRTLSPEEWQRPSQCDQWQVADVVAHLTGMSTARRIERGLQGDVTPPEDMASPGTVNEDAFRDGLAQRALALRHQLGDQLLTAFRAGNDQLDAVLADMEPQDWEKFCYHPVGPEPIRTIIDIRLTEVAMHGWDIRASFDPRASLSEDSLPALLQTIPRAVRRAFRSDANRPRAVRYRFHMTEPVTATTDILLNADGASVESGSQAEADVTFRCDTSTAVLVIFGRLTLADAITDGCIRVEGDQKLAITFAQSFQGG